MTVFQDVLPVPDQFRSNYSKPNTGTTMEELGDALTELYGIAASHREQYQLTGPPRASREKKNTNQRVYMEGDSDQDTYVAENGLI